MNKGIDVAYYDRGMNWSQYIWDFAFIKVSEGTVIDPEFKTHWTNARGHTQRGAYHFFRAFVDPLRAVTTMLEYLDGDFGELPPVLDLEDIDEIDVKTAVSRALTWLIETEKKVNKIPIVYSSPGFINTLKLYLYPDFARYPLWLSVWPYDNYNLEVRTKILYDVLKGNVVPTVPPIPKPFKVMKYWQWTAKGNPADVPGYYMGTGHKLAVDFNFQIDGILIPEPEPQPGGTMYFKVTYATVNLRSSAAVLSTNDLGNTDATNLKINDIIEVENMSLAQGGYTWRKVLRWWRANIEIQLPSSPTGEVWAAEKAGATGYYMVSTNFTPPTPGPNPTPSLTHEIEVYSDGSIKVDGNPIA